MAEDDDEMMMICNKARRVKFKLFGCIDFAINYLREPFIQPRLPYGAECKLLGDVMIWICDHVCLLLCLFWDHNNTLLNI